MTEAPARGVMIRERPDRMTWALFSLLVLGLLLLGAHVLVPVLTHIRAEWIATIPQVVPTENGRIPIQWIVRLRIDEDVAEARFMSEREAAKLEEATR